MSRPPNLAVLLTHCGQLTLRKISKFNATREEGGERKGKKREEEGRREGRGEEGKGRARPPNILV